MKKKPADIAGDLLAQQLRDVERKTAEKRAKRNSERRNRIRTKRCEIAKKKK